MAVRFVADELLLAGHDLVDQQLRLAAQDAAEQAVVGRADQGLRSREGDEGLSGGRVEVVGADPTAQPVKFGSAVVAAATELVVGAVVVRGSRSSSAQR